MPRVRRVFFASWVACAALVVACAQPPLDLAPMEPIRLEDARVIALLREIDRESQRDPRGAARSIRELCLPRARANVQASAALHPAHPRAQSLASDLRSVLDERVVRLERYAAALDSGDLEAMLRETRAQRALEDDVVRLERRFEAAAREPPPRRGCAR